MTIQPLLYNRLILRLPRPGLILQKVKGRLGKKPIVPIDFFQNVLRNCNLTVKSPIEVLGGGVRSETWVVHTDAGKKVLKRYKSNAVREQILHEHSILRHLARINFPAPRLVSDVHGNSMLEHENRFYAMYDFLEGHYKFTHYIYIPNQDEHWFTAMGQSLGELHNALCDCTPDGYNVYGFPSKTGERVLNLSWSLEMLEKNRQASVDRRSTTRQSGEVEASVSYLIEKADWIGGQMKRLEAELRSAPLVRQTIHGDFGPYNLMVNPEHRIIPIDFELARIEWRLVDLIAAFSSSTSGKQKTDSIKRMRWIAQGYQSVNPIAKEEWQMLPQIWQFVSLRRLITCWDQYLGQGSRERLEEAQRRLAKLNWIEQSRPTLESLLH